MVGDTEGHSVIPSASPCCIPTCTLVSLLLPLLLLLLLLLSPLLLLALEALASAPPRTTLSALASNSAATLSSTGVNACEDGVDRIRAVLPALALLLLLVRVS